MLQVFNHNLQKKRSVVVREEIIVSVSNNNLDKSESHKLQLRNQNFLKPLKENETLEWQTFLEIDST